MTHDFTKYFGFSEPEGGAGIERAEFETACGHLTQAGYTLQDGEGAWKQFSALRKTYAVHLNTLARWLEIPPVQWVGDRTLLRAPH